MGIYNPLNTVFNLQLQVGFCKFIKIPELQVNIAFQGSWNKKTPQWNSLSASLSMHHKSPTYC